MVLLAIRHRLRVSEVTGLRVEHVNVNEGWIRVERLKDSLATVQTLEHHPGQPLLDEVRVLSRWLRERRDDVSGVLFVSSHGGRMNRSTFARLWRRLAEDGRPAAGQVVSPHRQALPPTDRWSWAHRRNEPRKQGLARTETRRRLLMRLTLRLDGCEHLLVLL
jgi:type 1 fimbriae regulatory protein FimE